MSLVPKLKTSRNESLQNKLFQMLILILNSNFYLWENMATTLDPSSINYIENKRYHTQRLKHFFRNGGNNVVILEYIDSDE